MKQTSTTIKELENLKTYFNQINSYSNLKIKLLGIENLTSSELNDISNFKVKYQISTIINFSNEELIEELITIGENIINLKK
ncbi:hypothetical protein [Bizionia psychrotolerans]|uniref:hypothetical protein n=1 Tax=Bizionia psychrotolerans TaxID=1492901 RepID=UPI000651105F|nr:hypothetical protein [Bizionia psychrotolerans]